MRKKQNKELKKLKKDLELMGAGFMLLIETPYRIFENFVNATAETFKAALNNPQKPKN